MNSIKNGEDVKKYIEDLQRSISIAYEAAYSPTKDDGDHLWAIDDAMKAFLLKRANWAKGEGKDEFVYMGKHKFYIERTIFAAQGLGFFPINMAKGIARWEMEELVHVDEEGEKTRLIQFGQEYISKLEWTSGYFKRRRIQK